MFDVPNLDALDEGDLGKWRSEQFRIACASCLQTGPEWRARWHLIGYATHRVQAMKLRKAGDIQAAMRHEQECDVIYRRLPEWARW